MARFVIVPSNLYLMPGIHPQGKLFFATLLVAFRAAGCSNLVGKVLNHMAALPEVGGQVDCYDFARLQMLLLRRRTATCRLSLLVPSRRKTVRVAKGLACQPVLNKTAHVVSS